MKAENIESNNITDIIEVEDDGLLHKKSGCSNERPKLVYLIVFLSAVLPFFMIAVAIYAIVSHCIGLCTLSCTHPVLGIVIFLFFVFYLLSVSIGLWKGKKASRNGEIFLSVIWLLGSCWNVFNNDMPIDILWGIFSLYFVLFAIPTALLFIPHVSFWFNRSSADTVSEK